MLTPVVGSTPSRNLVGFVPSRELAAKAIGARCIRYRCLSGCNYQTPEEAWTAAGKLKASWSAWLFEHQPADKDGRVTPPQVVPAVGGGWRVLFEVFATAKDSPVARTISEALASPLSRVTRTMTVNDFDGTGKRMVCPLVVRVLGHDANRRHDVVGTAVRKAILERKFASEITRGSITLRHAADGVWAASLVWFQVPPVMFDRDLAMVDLGENYDVWGNWHPDEIAIPGFGQGVSLPSEGTGRVMGS